MKLVLSSLLALALLQPCPAPPVVQAPEDVSPPPGNDTEINGLEDYMEYHRYLKEVVGALESDPEFRKKLETADENAIRSGKIAHELEFVSHHVRTRLDEIKRIELIRLKDLFEKKNKLQQETFDGHNHLDHSNPHTFEINDLKKLIAKTTQDLAEADRNRKKEFKEYEMQKAYEQQVNLNHTEGEARKKLEQEIQEREQKHKTHKKLHEPGHKAQLEEVWQEQDQMQQDFDPKTFFMLHDLDSNGLWDQDEVKALFVKELEKLYSSAEPGADLRERAEELERMRESVFTEMDLNRDGMIDYMEFFSQTKESTFQQDNGWQGIDERRPYTDQELEAYINQHAQGVYPPGVGYHPNGQPYYPQPIPGHLPDLNTNEIYPNQHQPPHPNYQQPNQHYQQPNQHYQQSNQHYQQPNQQYQQPNQQYQHPNQPPHYQQQPPHQQANYQQPPIQHPNQLPIQQQANYQQQVPAGQVNQPQAPVVPQQNQPPVQQQNQPPVQQQNQPPVHQQNQPPVHQQNQPPLQQQNHPPVQQQNQPPVQQQNQPPVQQQNQPPVQQQNGQVQGQGPPK